MASAPGDELLCSNLSIFDPAVLMRRIASLESTVSNLSIIVERLMREKSWASSSRSTSNHAAQSEISNRHRCPVDDCSSTFERLDHLNRHIRGCSDERHQILAPALDQTHCVRCDRKFNRPCDLVRHEKLAHGEKYLSRASKFMPQVSGFEGELPLPTEECIQENYIPNHTPNHTPNCTQNQLPPFQDDVQSVSPQHFSTFQQCIYPEANEISQYNRPNIFLGSSSDHQGYSDLGSYASSAAEHIPNSNTSPRHNSQHSQSSLGGSNIDQTQLDLFSATPDDSHIGSGLEDNGVSRMELPSHSLHTSHSQSGFQNQTWSDIEDMTLDGPYDSPGFVINGSNWMELASHSPHTSHNQSGFQNQAWPDIFNATPDNPNSQSGL